MRISIYLLNKNRDIKEYIKEEAHEIYKLNVKQSNLKKSNKIEGYLVYQKKENELDWITKINGSKWIVNKQQIDNINVIKRGFLLFKLTSDAIAEDKPAIFLISFNGGINLVKGIYVDYNFGYSLASKLVSKNKIRNYGSTDIHENIIKTDKNSSSFIPKHLIGESLILSTIDSITGYSDSEDFISGNKGLILNYSGEFNTELVQILEYLYLEYNEPETGDSDIYNKLKKVKNIEEIDMLNETLCEQIQEIKSVFLSRGRELLASDLRFVNISVDFNVDIIGYKYTGLNKFSKIYDEIDKIEYFEQLSKYLDMQETTTSNQLLQKLKRDKIMAIKDSMDNIEYSLYNSLVVRLPSVSKKSEQISMLIGGNWYYVNKDYYSTLNERLESKVIREDGKLDKFSFIDFNKNTYENELKYNEEFAKVNNGVLLDEKFFNISKDISERKYNGYSKIEPCDILLFDQTENKYYFIHTKINSNTQGISHLSTQANISTNLLLDLEASNKFIYFINEQIKEQNCTNIPELREIRSNNICVILSIIDKDYDKSLKANFTILKLQALDNSIARLEQLGVEVKIKLIRDSSN